MVQPNQLSKQFSFGERCCNHLLFLKLCFSSSEKILSPGGIYVDKMKHSFFSWAHCDSGGFHSVHPLQKNFSHHGFRLDYIHLISQCSSSAEKPQSSWLQVWTSSYCDSGDFLNVHPLQKNLSHHNGFRFGLPLTSSKCNCG